MESLENTIAFLSNPHPNVLDPEDDVNIETVTDIKKLEEMDVTYNLSKLRSKTAPLLEDVDPKYTGKKVSRKSLQNVFDDNQMSSFNDEDGSISDENASVSNEDASDNLSYNEESENSDDDKLEDFSDENLTDFKNSFMKQNVDSDKNSQDEKSDEDISDEVESGNESGMTNQFSSIDVTSEVEKGKAVKVQQELWNRLVECRIKLQKLLVLANKCPQSDSWHSLNDKCPAAFLDISKGASSIEILLKKLMDLQTELLNQTHVANNITGNKSDEEIPSDTDEEMDEVPDKVGPTIKSLKRKFKSDEDYSEILAKQHKSLVPYRNSVIQKWDEKTRLATGRLTQKSFAAFDNSALKQIEQILQDKNRLIKRTQLKRSLYRVLGKPIISEKETEENSETDKSKSKQDMLLKDYDPEIFDDDDYYRQLLKDVIESKSVGIDPSLLRKQMEIQKIRNKMKRKVDTKASKGRKLRYDVHPKLVNFMAPVQTSFISDEARDNLLKCLFGRNSAKT